MFHLLSLVLGAVAVMLSWVLPIGAYTEDALAEDSTLDKIKDTVDAALESDESKMKRGLRELDERRKEEEILRQQRNELDQLEWEKKQALRMPGKQHAITKYGNARSSSAVELFVVSNCPDCLKAIGYLDGTGVNYSLYQIDRDPGAEQEYLSAFGRGIVPVLRTRGLTMRGYAPEQFERVAGRRKTVTSTTVTNTQQIQKGSPSAANFSAADDETAPDGTSAALDAGSNAGLSADAAPLGGTQALDSAAGAPPKPMLPPARKLGGENQFDVSGTLDAGTGDKAPGSADGADPASDAADAPSSQPTRY